MQQRVHSVDGDKYHWAVDVHKAGVCPTCSTPNGQLCVGLPKHTVHVARVRALGHNVR